MTAYALLDLQLQTPVMVTGPGGGDPNSEVTLTFLPGSVIRGALVARYRGNRDVTDTGFNQLFLSGRVRYLNGYLLKEGKRTLPTPASWQKVKDSDLNSEIVNVFDLAVADPDPDEQLKSLGETFFVDDDEIEPGRPQSHITIHIARRNRQRPTDAGSTVFRYDSLAPGQTFRSVLLADEVDDLTTLQESLPDGCEITIGRSHRSGYGLVKVSWAEMDDEEMWPEYTSTENEPELGLIVTLLSDCLVRDPKSGAYADNLAPLVNAKPVKSFVRTHVVGGFNRKWNLPLTQATAISAGSVFAYDFSEELAKELAEFESSGIGERTIEGFGRIAVNWHHKAQFSLEREGAQTIKPNPNAPKQLDGEARTMADTMLRRMADLELDSRLTDRLSQLKVDPKPSNSQLARLRIVAKKDQRAAIEARAQTRSCSMAHLSGYLDKNELRKPAREQLQQAKISNKSLLAWLSTLAQDPQSVWGVLNFEPQSLKSIGGVRAEQSDADAVYYCARLVDAVCRQASKEETPKVEREDGNG